MKNLVILISLVAGIAVGADENPFDFNIDELKKVDPALVGYEQVQAVDVDIKKPTALAVGPDGSVYVAGEKQLRKWNKDLKDSSVTDLDADAAAIAVDADGTVYIGMKEHIEVIPVEGEKISWAELGEDSLITSVTISGDYIFAADAGQKVLWKYSKKGRMEERIGGRDSIAGKKGFIVPSANFDAAHGRDGSVWVVNPGMHTLIHIGADGKVLDSWSRASNGIDGFCGCCNPCHIALLDDGSIVTAEKGLMRVKVVSAKGELLSVVAAPSVFEEGNLDAKLGDGAKPGMSEGIADIAVRGGQVLVLDRNAGLLRIFDRKKTQ